MNRKMFTWVFTLVGSVVLVLAGTVAAQNNTRLRVVATLPDYEVFAKAIGGNRITVESIVLGNQDAHFIRPKPSFVNIVRKADVLISTGLDLELWIPTIIDKAANSRVRSGQQGYIAAAHGMKLLEKPKSMSRSEGGVHIYGNPHVTCSPVKMKTAVENIAYGLIKNDPEGKKMYLENLNTLHHEFDKRLFGGELVDMLGGKLLCELAEKDKLIHYLKSNKYKNRYLIDLLGGWMKRMLPLRDMSIVTYHKNWVYFLHLFGLKEAGTVEPKPGMPPTPRHVTELINLMRSNNIRIILAANYFDEHKVRTVASKVGAEAVIVPIYVRGIPGVKDYFQLVDYWVDSLISAAQKVGIKD